MDNNIKNSLLLAGSAVAGGYGGSWAAQRLCDALGCSLGPWGSAIGAMVGAMAGSALAKSMLGDKELVTEFEPETTGATAPVKE